VGKLRTFIIIVMSLVFLVGLGISLYPTISGYLIDRQIEIKAEDFLDRDPTRPTKPTTEPTGSFVTEVTLPPDTTQAPEIYTELWYDMQAYNATIYREGQQNLSCEYAYEKPSFKLADYGLEDEIFGVISIPKLELEMPIYLGATYQHLADGAAHLSQTSIPLGGDNTNSVIAGHRGWGGASYFRYITKLEVGDEVIITNLWETTTYEVVEIKIIMPNEVEKILIQPGRELVTLMTCHPYASGGRQRYLVICEPVKLSE